MEQLTEEKLIQQARRGDQDAISQLYESTKNYAWFVARRYLQNDEDIADVLQDSYISAFGKLNTFEDGKSFKTWLHSIVVNKCLNFLRRKKSFHISTGEIAELVNDDEEIIPAAWLERAEKRRDIIRIIDALPEGQRMAISLFYIEGLPLSEMAGIMGISEGAAKSHLYRGRKAIKEAVLLEEKKGNKLYGIVMVPLLTQLFEMEAEAAVMPEEMSKIVWEGTLRGLAAAQSGGSGDGTSGQNVPKSGTGGATPTAAKNVVKAATKMISKKAIIAAVSVVGAAAVIIAGVIFLPPLFNSPDNSILPGVSDTASPTPGTTEPSGTETPGTSETPAVPDIPEAPASDFEYETTALGIVITKYIGNSAEVRIPEKIDGKPVVEIGQDAFYDCKSLKSVNVPQSVTAIINGAFGNCASLESVTMYYHSGMFLPVDGWLRDSKYIFEGSNSIKSLVVIVDGTVQKIDDDAFYGLSQLTDVIIPNSVTAIGKNAFWDCTSLKSITIPNSVTEIGEMAFVNSGLKNVTIPDSVTSMGDNVFMWCPLLESVTLNGALPDNPQSNHQFFDGCSSLSSVTIGDSVTTIPGYIFQNLQSLTTVKIGNNVTSIGDSAFSGCTSLKSIDIPDGVTFIGYAAFGGCGSQSINIPKSMTHITDGAFYGIGMNSLTIPDWVTSIGKDAFKQCESLTSVIIPNSVKSIEAGAFWGCLSLRSITIPDSVTRIDTMHIDQNNMYVFGAFDGMPDLTATYKGKTYKPSYFDGWWLMPDEFYNAINNG